MCTLGNLGSPGNFHLGDSGGQDFYLRGLWWSGKLILVDCLCVCVGGGSGMYPLTIQGYQEILPWVI